jgi:hypothetical protein
MNNEAKTLGLVNDIADLLGDIATGPQHTPALYSAFLKALIKAKGATSQAASPSIARSAAMNDSANSSGGIKEPVLVPNAEPEGNSAATPGLQFSSQGLDFAHFSDYNLGEMGPSVEPASVAPTPRMSLDDTSNVLSVDSVLTPHFWDSIIFPGKIAIPLFT